MPDDDFAARRKAAYTKLDEAIAALHELFRSEHDDDDDDDEAMPQGEVPIDAVLLIGSQYYTDEGDRNGCVTICPRNGWQPGYITAGLLAQSLAVVTA